MVIFEERNGGSVVLVLFFIPQTSNSLVWFNIWHESSLEEYVEYIDELCWERSFSPKRRKYLTDNSLSIYLLSLSFSHIHGFTHMALSLSLSLSFSLSYLSPLSLSSPLSLLLTLTVTHISPSLLPSLSNTHKYTSTHTHIYITQAAKLSAINLQTFGYN